LILNYCGEKYQHIIMQIFLQKNTSNWNHVLWTLIFNIIS